MCGVVGIVGSRNSQYSRAVQESYNGLLKLQHRGQDAAGMLFLDRDTQSLRLHKQMGLISDVFGQSNLKVVNSQLCIGHTRYATTGSNNASNLQPMAMPTMMSVFDQVGMAHNGNLVNYHEMVRFWEDEYGGLLGSLESTNDVEILLKLWTTFLDEGCGHFSTDLDSEVQTSLDFDSFVNATRRLMSLVDGAYAVVGVLREYGLIAFRDPNGIRPLVLGRKEDNEGVRYCVTSETTALQMAGFEYIRDLRPAELLWIDLDGQLHMSVCSSTAQARHCMFEWVYFSGADSIMEGRSVYGSRLELGRRLARRIEHLTSETGWEPDIVCPVPDTSRPSTIALSEALTVPYREVFIKNRYVQRSFILNSQESRERAVQSKLSPIISEIQGRDLLIVDDSIVRGTTSKNIVRMLRRCGAKSVVLGITCPPLRHPCFYGVDFPSNRELIASNKTVVEIAEWIGVDHLVFLEPEDLTESIGNELCMGCINGCYPTERRGYQEFSQHRRGHDTI